MIIVNFVGLGVLHQLSDYRSPSCRDRGVADGRWGRLRCPGQSNGSTVIEFLHQDSASAPAPHPHNPCLNLGCVPPPGQRKRPRTTSTQPLSQPWVRSSTRTAQAPPHHIHTTPVPTGLYILFSQSLYRYILFMRREGGNFLIAWLL